jgi:F1F0 ATPase subunit 2
MTWMNPSDVALYLAAGVALGAVYFVLLLRTVHLYASQGAAVRFMALCVLRFATAASAFWVIAQRGAMPLLLALLGFLVARIAIQFWTKWE